MQNNKYYNRVKKFGDAKLIGGYTKRYSYLYIALLFVVALFEAVLFTRELFLIREIPLRHTFYLVLYVILFTASIAAAVFLITQRKGKNNEKLITIVIHTYAVVGIVWGLCVSLVDFWGNIEFPIVFFTILATIGGLLVLNPYIFLPIMVTSTSGMIVAMYYINPELFKPSNIINFVVLFIMIGVISYRTSAVAVTEEEQKNILTKMSHFDVLTGLQNENAYYKFLDELENGELKDIRSYAVIVMDVNGLKWTDDTYGHRYGAHLISLAGRILPTIFKNCDIFHTGGDEFVCVVTKEFEHLYDYLEDFKAKLEYQPVTFEGQNIFLSVAMGIAIHLEGEKYNATYQRADREMYKNKPLIKEKYNIKGR